MEGKGAVVIEVDRDEQGRISLPQAMRELRGAGIGSVLCEGGGIVGRGLLERGLVDRIYLILAPIFLGPGGVPGFPPEVALPSAVAEPLEDDPVPWEWAEEPRRIGSDLWMVLEPRGR